MKEGKVYLFIIPYIPRSVLTASTIDVLGLANADILLPFWLIPLIKLYDGCSKLGLIICFDCILLIISFFWLEYKDGCWDWISCFTCIGLTWSIEFSLGSTSCSDCSFNGNLFIEFSIYRWLFSLTCDSLLATDRFYSVLFFISIDLLLGLP